MKHLINFLPHDEYLDFSCFEKVLAFFFTICCGLNELDISNYLLRFIAR